MKHEAWSTQAVFKLWYKLSYTISSCLSWSSWISTIPICQAKVSTAASISMGILRCMVYVEKWKFSQTSQARRRIGRGASMLSGRPLPSCMCARVSSMLCLLSRRTLTLQHEDQNGRKETKKTWVPFYESEHSRSKMPDNGEPRRWHSFNHKYDVIIWQQWLWKRWRLSYDDGSDSGTESEASPGLQDSEEKSHHSEQSSGALESCYT